MTNRRKTIQERSRYMLADRQRVGKAFNDVCVIERGNEKISRRVEGQTGFSKGGDC